MTTAASVTPEETIVTTCGRMGEAGEVACLDNCAMRGADSIFSYAKVRAGEALPPADPTTLDIAVLDMHHGWPNLGHNSIVQAVREAACDFEPAIREAGLKIRVFSFDVRGAGLLPESPGGRFSIYLGTGGPGHIDPHFNDGVHEYSQGVKEDPAWEAKAFALFDAILANKDAALVAICHSFGVLCRWSGIAEPTERTDAKGGKSAGIVENALTPTATHHPWFSAFARKTGSSRFRAIDSRLFDLIPNQATVLKVAEFAPLSFETSASDHSVGDALTGVEFARDPTGVMPRMYGVNHHPEIMDGRRQRLIIEKLWEHGEVTRAWYEERLGVLAPGTRDAALAHQLSITTGFTFVWPLRFHLVRTLRLRAERLNRTFGMLEDAVTARALESLPTVNPATLPGELPGGDAFKVHHP
ncbi:MAG: hypothetical protein ABI672_15750 [Vicinamibacteria bacterium]